MFGAVPGAVALGEGCSEEVTDAGPAWLCGAGAVLTEDSPFSLSESRALEGCPFLRFAVGMRHSIWKATQLVQGTPRLAASHRTFLE